MGFLQRPGDQKERWQHFHLHNKSDSEPFKVVRTNKSKSVKAKERKVKGMMVNMKNLYL